MRPFPVPLALLLGLVFAASASAATFTVNDAGDAGDGTCDVSCTMRDAVEAADANGSATADTIDFGVSQLTLTAGPVSIDQGNLTISGCSGATSSAPCVTIEAADFGTDALHVNAGGVHVDRVAISTASTAIAGNSSSSGLKVTGSWLGLTAAGTASGVQTGISLAGPTSLIGGTTAADRNRIENAQTVGVQIASSSNTIAGNDFTANTVGITFGGSGASGNAIGGALSDAAVATTACDGACNSFASGAGNAIEVTNSASDTAIKGNYVGLDASGASAVNGGTGISITSGSDTDVGGFMLGDPNVIQGGAYGVLDQGRDSVIWRNLVGLDPAGTTKTAAPSAAGIHIDEPGSGEAALFSNTVAIPTGSGSGAIEVAGTNAVLKGNQIGVSNGANVGGSGYGIRVSGTNAEVGGSDQGSGNTVAHADSIGIDLTGVKGSVVQNNVLTANGRGVVVRQSSSALGGEASGNVIGGDTAATANRITGSTNDAIALLPRTNSAVGNPNADNEISVNTGSGNGTDPTKDLFIDLADPLTGGAGVADGPGNTSAVNNGITPPTVTKAGASTVRGGSAQSGAVVRVFTRPAGAVGALGSYVGSTTAASDGTWTVTAGSAVADGAKVVATQSGTTDGTSEVSGESTVDGIGPTVTITSGPSGSTTDTTPTFGFSSEPGATFECQVDTGAYAACTSPRTTATLAAGAHTFRVRGKDGAGNVGAPATRSFTIPKASSPPPPPARDTTAPNTTITSHPKALTRSRSPKFSFKATEPAVIECSIDGKKYEVCSVIGPLRDGKHTLRARAYDLAGNTDATPASFTFRVDATAPKVKLGAVAKRKGKTLRIKVACPKAEKSGPCRGTLTVKRKGKVVAKKAYKIKAGKTATVVLKPKHLPAKGAKLALSTTARDKLGNNKAVKKTARVR